MLDDLTSVEFLLSVTFAGRTFYFSTRPVVLLDERGEPIQYRGGLEANWTDALNLFNESPTLLSVPLELFFPEDVAELISRGHDLWRGTGELSLWIEGRPYEDRVVLIDGFMTEPSYGAKGEAVKFSLEANGFQDSALTHSQTERVSLDTWPTPAENAIDAYYPIVFGTPGAYTLADGSSATTYGSPAPVCQGVLPNCVAIAAGHSVEATEVTVFNVSQFPVASDVVPIVETVDSLGQVVSTVSLAAAALSFSPGDSIFIAWNRDGGGAWNTKRTDTISGAGELIAYFLNLSSLKVDTGVWRTLSPYLDSNFKFAGYVNNAVKPWEFLARNVLSFLPLSVYATGEGVHASLWRREAEKSAAVGTITTGGGVCRSGPVQYEKQDIYNNIRFDFVHNASEGQTLRSVGVIGDHEPTRAESGLFSTEYSRASYFRYGSKSLTLASKYIYESATAQNILQWKHRAAAFPYRVISYDVPIRMGFLRRGDLILLTDPEIYLSEYLALVRNIEWKDGKPRLSLVLIDDPPRENRLN